MLAKLDQEELKSCKVVLVFAGLGDGFNHTNNLHSLKYKEAISGPDSKAWKPEAKKEHKQMIQHEIERPVKRRKGNKNIWFCMVNQKESE